MIDMFWLKIANFYNWLNKVLRAFLIVKTHFKFYLTFFYNLVFHSINAKKSGTKNSATQRITLPWLSQKNLQVYE